jgi:hypothetical protein
LAVPAFYIQAVLKNYHRNTRSRRLGDGETQRIRGVVAPMMTRNTRQQIERQLAQLIRRRIIQRAFGE